MSWKACRLVYQAMSPIHIGWHTLGYIKLTRNYIPGRSIWGAIVSNMTRTFGREGIKDYKKFDELFKTKMLRHSYFYPAVFSDNPLLPHYTEKGIVYGDPCRCHYLKEDFEMRFIDSFGQTAVLPESNTAEDESLHELEYISPCIRAKEDYRPVFFVGYIFIREDACFNDRPISWDNAGISLKPAIRELFIGGDRKYGWGKLSLDIKKTKKVKNSKFFGNSFNPKKEGLTITIEKGKPIPAHLEIEPETNLKMKGDIEPLVGREWAVGGEANGKVKIGAGQNISEAKMCWVPGSVVEENKGLELTIDKFGILIPKKSKK